MKLSQNMVDAIEGLKRGLHIANPLTINALVKRGFIRHYNYQFNITQSGQEALSKYYGE